MNKLHFGKGDDCPASKLNEKLIKKILDERESAIIQREILNKKIHAKSLALEYGVHVRTMEKALTGVTWSHIV